MTDGSSTISDSSNNEPLKLKEVAPIETTHEITLNRKKLKYTAHTGTMPLKDEKGTIEAEMFYTAYFLQGHNDPAKRPMTFVFNGGPGSSSVWLHIGALGPKRVLMHDEGWMPAPPFKLVPNESTWLDKTDLVFIDPVGTGFSRAAKPDDNQKYWSIDGDIASIGTFIRLFLNRYNRWASPLFMAGESYGTTRAAGIAGHLVEQGIVFNGLSLISTVLNFQTLRRHDGNNLPDALFLPTFTATAWYHGKLSKDLQEKPLRAVLDEVEAWAEGDYASILMRGDKISDKERSATIRKLSRYTGLSTSFIDNGGLGVDIFAFCKELLRDQKRTVGRLDSRFTGIDKNSTGAQFEHDPSHTAINAPYTAMINDYLRRELGYYSDRVYEIISNEVFPNWQYARGHYPDTSEALRKALSKNPYMQVLFCMGYYDLATPHFATLYTINHMSLDPSLRQNLHIETYEAGHMFYLEVGALAKLKADVVKFMDVALPEA
jgi:carboxypeptidase C (cathepsin A)